MNPFIVRISVLVQNTVTGESKLHEVEELSDYFESVLEEQIKASEAEEDKIAGVRK